MVTYAQISPKMMNPRDVAEERRRRRRIPSQEPRDKTSSWRTGLGIIFRFTWLSHTCDLTLRWAAGKMSQNVRSQLVNFATSIQENFHTISQESCELQEYETSATSSAICIVFVYEAKVSF